MAIHETEKEVLARSNHCHTSIVGNPIGCKHIKRFGPIHLYPLLGIMKQMKSDPSKTLLTISVGFAVIFWFIPYKWLLLVSIVVGLIGILSAPLSRLIERAWMKLAYILSLIVPNIVLGIVFFVFLLPLSILSKIFRKEDPLRLKNNLASVYKDRTEEYDKAHFENMW